MTTHIDIDEETIKNDVNEEEEGLDEDRTIGTSDENDDDPSDTTPAEAEELADEGGEIIKKLRNKDNDD